MKKLMILAVIAMGAISCSKTDITEELNEQNEIRFASVQMGNGIITRANESLTGSETFGVYAFLTAPVSKAYISSETLSKTGDVWGLSKKYYFPTGDFSMNFWAWGKDKTKNTPTSVSATGLVYTDYAVDQAKAADHEAFVISKNVVTIDQTKTTTAVALNFWHALSKINFTAKITNATNFETVDVKITDITINTSKTGSITYANSSSKWTPGEKTDETITITNKNALTVESSAVASNFYVIPLALDADINTITVKADLYHKGTDVKIANQITGEINATGVQLAINNSVTYNIIIDLSKVSGQAEIKFTEPTIEDWTPVEGGNSTFPPTTQP